MIFYFSGTGNSLWVARQLGDALDEKLISIADELKQPSSGFVYPLRKDEKVFFVFPVHSWGPAVLILRFIEKMKWEGYTGQPVYAICTCGDNCGYTSKIVGEALKNRSIVLTKGYSIQMPNNYILMKGFGVDPKVVEKEKLSKAPGIINRIIKDMQIGQDVRLYVEGKFPYVKSHIIYPLFLKYALGKNKFYAKDNCTACGLCVKVCPVSTISMQGKKPVWSNACVQCTACIHRCPVRAIEYGKVSEKQGRYHHPDI